MTENPQGAAPSLSLPTLAEASAWSGHRIDEVGGSSVARIQSVFVDGETGEPVWVIAKVGRFGKAIAIPFLDCAPGVGRVWVPYTRETLRGAPGIDPAKPLTREQELAICAHYGVHDELGRAREVKERPEGAITSQLASGGG